MLHKDAGETLTHSVLHFLHSLIPPHFDCIECQQHHFSLSLWLPYWPNQSGNIWCSTLIPLLRAFRMLDSSVLPNSRFNICCAIVFTDIWIIQVAIPVKPIFVVRNALRWAIRISFDWMTVESSDSADIAYLSSSPREVLWRQSWWQRWSFWQCKCSRTIMLKEWPGCFGDLFRFRTVSYGCHLLILSVRLLLCST